MIFNIETANIEFEFIGARTHGKVAAGDVEDVVFVDVILVEHRRDRVADVERAGGGRRRGLRLGIEIEVQFAAVECGLGWLNVGGNTGRRDVQQIQIVDHRDIAGLGDVEQIAATAAEIQKIAVASVAATGDIEQFVALAHTFGQIEHTAGADFKRCVVLTRSQVQHAAHLAGFSQLGA